MPAAIKGGRAGASSRVTPPAHQPPATPQTDFGKKVMAHTRYRTSAGKQVPGVTTVLGVLNKPALVAWANRLGLEGIDSRSYTDEAAAVGKLAHALIECELKGEDPDLSDFSQAQIDRAQFGVEAFHTWRAAHQLEPVLVEASIVSDEFGFGGTIDCVAVLDDVLTLLDFKTSSGIYDEHKFQVSAYWRLLKEAGYEIKGARILKIGRTEGEGLEEHTITGRQILHGWRIFEHCLEIYQLRKGAK